MSRRIAAWLAWSLWALCVAVLALTALLELYYTPAFSNRGESNVYDFFAVKPRLQGWPILGPGSPGAPPRG